MKLPTLTSLITGITLASVCTLSLAKTASALDATATQAVNVRSGPGVSYSKVDVLSSGEDVNITECQGRWCYVEHSGPDGWVSGRYLRADEATTSGQSSNQQMDPALTAILGAILGAVIIDALDNDEPTPPTPTPPTPTPPVTANFTGLYLYYSGEREDNFSTATINGIQAATGAGYRLVRKQGCILTNKLPGTVPLNLYWHGGRGDNFTTATGAVDAQNAGYQFVRTLGYIYASPNNNTRPLRLHWSAARGDNFTSSTSQGAAAANAANYRSVRNEGHIGNPTLCN